MSPQRARTYFFLFLAMSGSVCANLLLFQSGREPHRAAAAASETKAHRAATAPGGRAVDPISETIRAIQRELKELRLYPGQIDGKPSPLVHAAIIAYEQAQALPITGEPTQSLLRDLIVGPSAASGPAPGRGVGVAPNSAAERLIRDVRQNLVTLGYAPGNGDGRMTVELIQSIRAFERDSGQPQTGRISPQLILQLQRSSAAFRPKAS